MKFAQRMQAVFPSPSLSLEELSLEADKAYVVHQVLSQGALLDIQWLLGVYGFAMVRNIFLDSPMKVYTPASLNLSRVILGLPVEDILPERYDKTVSRRIG